MRIVPTFTLWLPGPPMTRQEPLLGKRGHYPNPATVRGMRTWRSLWMTSGRLRVEPPVVLEVYIRVERPEYHLGVQRQVIKAGKAHPYPGGFDCSNVVKLVEDALKGMAFGDDSEIIAVHATKRWVLSRDDAGTVVTLTTAGAARYAEEA